MNHTASGHTAADPSRPSAEHFYWAVLTVPRTRPRQRVSARRFAFEPWVPAPIENVEMRFRLLRSMPDGRELILACGIEHNRLAALIHQGTHGPGPTAARLPSLIPAEAPATLAALSSFDSQALNTAAHGLEFRSGRYECPDRKRHRRRLIGLSAALYLVTCTLLTALWATAASRHRSDAARWRHAADELARGSVQEAGTNRPEPSVDPRLLLLAEVRTLRQTRDADLAPHASEDRLDTLLDLLARWPEDIPVLVRSLSLDQDLIGVRGEVRDAGEYEQLASALGSSATGWSRPVGNASRAQQGYSFNLSMRRERSGLGRTAISLSEPAP